MADTREGEPTDLYERFSAMSFEDVEAHLEELQGRFARVVRHYTGPLGQLRKNIKDGDSTEVYSVFGDLLPMSLNPEVQGQLTTDLDTNPDALLTHRIAAQIEDVMLFMSRFENTGIEVFWAQSSLLD